LSIIPLASRRSLASARRSTGLASLILAAGLWMQGAAQTKQTLVYLGTYTGEKTQSRGIYVTRLDPATGALSAPEVAAETQSPSFLAIHPSKDVLVAVNEIGSFEGKPTGSVSAFTIDRASGRLSPINQQSSGGRGPAHVIFDRSGRFVLAANYGGGNAAVLPIDDRLQPPSSVVQHEGSSVNPQRQREPHAHFVTTDAANTRAFVVDLGLDKIMLYRFDSKAGTLTPNTPPFTASAPGSGPRHLALHPGGRFAYVINELTCTVTGYALDAATGAMKELQTISTLPAGQPMQDGFSGAEIQVHPSGQFVYASNRGHDTIAVFAVNRQTGQLTPVEHESTGGSTPRGFGIDPTGTFFLAANQRSNSVLVFRIDPKSGALTPTPHRIEVPSPVSVKFLQAR
jgi:6-phosphogluconolactonase